MTAIGTYIQFWLPQVPLWLIEIVMLALLFGLNTLNSRFFGETEFWFAMIKVAAIIGMIVTAIILVAGNFHYSTVLSGKTVHDSASLSNIFDGFQLFPHGAWNFVGALQMVMFAFTSMEFIGMTAAETVNPKKSLPKAINQIPVRILLFYVGALLAIMAIFNWHYIPADKSPFVMVFQLIGIKWAAALINFVVLTSAASALNSSLFSATRNMYSLAQQHDKGRLTPFTKLSKAGIPINALYMATALSLLAPVLTLIPQIKNAFDFAASCTTNLFLVVYFITLYTYWQYRKSEDYNPKGFLTPKPQITVPFIVAIFAIVFASLFFNADTFYPALGAIVWTIFFGLYSHYKKI